MILSKVPNGSKIKLKISMITPTTTAGELTMLSMRQSKLEPTLAGVTTMLKYGAPITEEPSL
jgi:hypothetical protein